MKHRSRLTPAILVLFLLAATPVFPQAHQGTAPRTTSFAEALHIFLPDFVGRLWADLGCVIDPFGSCRPAKMESGCGVDPFGACKPAVAPTARPALISLSGDLGCEIDPYGRCKSAVQNGGH